MEVRYKTESLFTYPVAQLAVVLAMHRDSATLLRPTLLVAGLTGLCPRLNSNKYNRLYLLFMCLAPFIDLRRRIVVNYNTYYDISCFVVLTSHAILYIQHIVILTETYIKRGDIQKYWTAMEAAQQILFSLNIRQPASPSLMTQVLWVIGSSIMLIILVIDSAIGFIFTDVSSSIIMFMVHSGAMIKLRVMLDLINDKLSLLIWHLDDLNNRWPLFLPRPPDVTFSEFNCVSSYRRTKFVNYDRDVRKVTAEKIRLFNKAHFLLYYAFKILNDMYSLSGLFVTLSAGCTFAHGAIFSSGKNSHQFLKLFVPVHLLVFLVTIFTYSTLIKEKSQKVAHFVHDLLDEEGHDPEVIDELEEFSKALLHRKMNFSASGFFDMDLKIVSRMASMLAPITIFLVQNTVRTLGRNSLPK